MAKKTAKKFNNSSFLVLIIITAFLFLALYLIRSNNFNLNSSAGRNRYSATGMLVMSSYSYNCNSQFQYGLINQSTDVCTSLVILVAKAEPFLNQNVKLNGALKDGIFYVTSIKPLQNRSSSNPNPIKTVRPVGSPDPTLDPIPLSDPIVGLPKGTPVIVIPPPRD